MSVSPDKADQISCININFVSKSIPDPTLRAKFYMHSIQSLGCPTRWSWACVDMVINKGQSKGAYNFCHSLWDSCCVVHKKMYIRTQHESQRTMEKDLCCVGFRPITSQTLKPYNFFIWYPNSTFFGVLQSSLLTWGPWGLWKWNFF